MQSTRSKTIFLMLVATVLLGFNSIASAHDVFKAPMQERFKLKTVSCSACHPGKEKSIHNKFGAMFVKAFKGMELTEKLEAEEAKGEKEKEAYEAVMVEAFKKALADIEKKEPMMIAVVDAGLLVGTKKTPEGLEAAQEVVVEFIAADADAPLFESNGTDGDAEAAKKK